MLITVVEEAYASALNMLRDQELLQEATRMGSPILRLYSWDTPTISLGKMQKADLLDKKALVCDGITVVTRPTGGRAVLHKGDFTYSLMIPSSYEALFGCTVQKTYAIVAQALQQSLMELGVCCSFSKREKSRLEMRAEAKSPCFVSPTKNELLVEGRKLIGSAQLRTKDGVIQHGSMPITDEAILLPLYENISSELRQSRCEELREKAIWMEKVVMQKYSFQDLAQAFIKGFSKALKMKSVALSVVSSPEAL